MSRSRCRAGLDLLPIVVLLLLAGAIAAPRTSAAPSAQGAPTATYTPPSTPPPTPTACASRERWLISVDIFPDDVGVAPTRPRLPAPGCDGFFTDADRWGAASCPLDPSWVIVYNPADVTDIYASAVLTRYAGQVTMSRLFWLCAPPPYAVHLVSTQGRCRTLCPNQPATRFLTESSFVPSFSGRYARVAWGFWGAGHGTTP